MTVRRAAIAKLLVASRGESARRILRTAKEMGIATVAVFGEADREALFTAEADEAVALDRFSDRGPGAYRDAAALIAAARHAGADALHPGAGVPAEDAGLAWRCAEAGIAFVGPRPETIATLRSKLEAKGVAAAAGVPVLTTEEVDGYPPGKLEAAAEVLGWPVVVKASAGQDGRGARVVREGDDLVAAVDAVRREAAAEFGDPTIFLEPWLESARHVEVQVFGDATGRVVPLFERDGSLQRLHRPVIEEAPAPRLPQPLRERLLAASVAVAEAVGYVGAGTVGFIVADDRFFFLGMNARLSTAHGVTEAILGLDLVRMQLAVAEGRPLPVEARHCSPSGHALAARLSVEEPAPAYGPWSGRLRRFEIGPVPGVRVEAADGPGSVVGSHEPGLATIVAHADTRAEAIRRLAAALHGMRIHGPRTNRDQLVAALRHPDFLAGAVDTGFLDRHGHSLGKPDAGVVRLHAAAAGLADLAARPDDPAPRRASFAGPGGERLEVTCRIDDAGAVLDMEVDGEALPGLRVGAAGPDIVDLEIDGLRRCFAVSRAGDAVDVDSVLGHTELVALGADAPPLAPATAWSTRPPPPPAAR